LVRASNTQPVLVMRFEAASEELLCQYREELESVVAQAMDSVQKKAGSAEPAVK
jgi:phosphomannomutase